MLCLPADSGFEVAGVIARTGKVAEERVQMPAARRPSSSGIPSDIADQPHGAGRWLKADAARIAMEVRKRAETDGRYR